MNCLFDSEIETNDIAGLELEELFREADEMYKVIKEKATSLEEEKVDLDVHFDLPISELSSTTENNKNIFYTKLDEKVKKVDFKYSLKNIQIQRDIISKSLK